MSVVNTVSKYFRVLIYDIKHTSYNLLKLYIGFKMYTFWINL